MNNSAVIASEQDERRTFVTKTHAKRADELRLTAVDERRLHVSTAREDVSKTPRRVKVRHKRYETNATRHVVRDYDKLLNCCISTKQVTETAAAAAAAAAAAKAAKAAAAE
jgi:hypothetical protein